MKIFITRPFENWIVDSMQQLFIQNDPTVITDDMISADILFLLSDWTWKQNESHLRNKKNQKIVCTVHHLVPDKFDRKDFYDRDQYVDYYTVFNQHTYNQVRLLTSKNIVMLPYWFDDKFWIPSSESKKSLREKYQLPINDNNFVVFSAVRDSEGSDLTKPKLEQGVDLFADYLENLNSLDNNIHVLLGGWRRDYLINRLKTAKIDYTYKGLLTPEILRDFYQLSDLVVNPCRFAGGPYALIEATAMKVPMISRVSGIADQVLPPESINNDLSLCQPRVGNIEQFKLSNGVLNHWYSFFQKII